MAIPERDMPMFCFFRFANAVWDAARASIFPKMLGPIQTTVLRNMNLTEGNVELFRRQLQGHSGVALPAEAVRPEMTVQELCEALQAGAADTPESVISEFEAEFPHRTGE